MTAIQDLLCEEAINAKVPLKMEDGKAITLPSFSASFGKPLVNMAVTSSISAPNSPTQPPAFDQNRSSNQDRTPSPLMPSSGPCPRCNNFGPQTWQQLQNHNNQCRSCGLIIVGGSSRFNSPMIPTPPMSYTSVTPGVYVPRNSPQGQRLSHSVPNRERSISFPTQPSSRPNPYYRNSQPLLTPVHSPMVSPTKLSDYESNAARQAHRRISSPNLRMEKEGKVCNNCSATKTPLWRRDESGKHICNACGLYFRLHKRMRPVNVNGKNGLQSATQAIIGGLSGANRSDVVAKILKMKSDNGNNRSEGPAEMVTGLGALVEAAAMSSMLPSLTSK